MAGTGLPEDFEEFREREGPERAAALLEGWKRLGWPGWLLPENARILRHATLRESLGADIADRAIPLEYPDGFEESVAVRLALAVNFIRRRAEKAAEEAVRNVGRR